MAESVLALLEESLKCRGQIVVIDERCLGANINLVTAMPVEHGFVLSGRITHKVERGPEVLDASRSSFYGV